MKPTLPVLSDEILLSLCDNSDYSRTYATRQAINDAIHEALRHSILSQVLGGRTMLGDRYPIVGKDSNDLYTKELVGFSYQGKRITVPTFEITTCPVVKAEHFRFRHIDLLRRVICESVEAMGLAELSYFQCLLKSASSYNKHYPLFNANKITIDVLLEATEPMVKRGIEPKVVFMNPKGSEKLQSLLSRLGMSLITSEQWGPEVYVFGVPPTGDTAWNSCTPAAIPSSKEASTGHLMDNGSSFIVKTGDGGVNMWHEPVKLKHTETVGFILSAVGALLINRKDVTVKQGIPPRRVEAFIVGEEGGDVERMYVED